MARRRSYRRVRAAPRRRYPGARRAYGAARGGGGSMKPLIDGMIAGAGGVAINKFLPVKGLGIPIAAIGVGYFRNNQVLKTEGSRELGAALASMFLGNGNSGTSGGTY